MRSGESRKPLVIIPAMAPKADAADQVVKIRVEQRFAAAEGNDAGAQFAEMVDAAVHLFGWHGRGKIVIFVAISTSQIAAANGDDVSQDWMFRGEEDRRQASALRARGDGKRRGFCAGGSQTLTYREKTITTRCQIRDLGAQLRARRLGRRPQYIRPLHRPAYCIAPIPLCGR